MPIFLDFCTSSRSAPIILPIICRPLSDRDWPLHLIYYSDNPRPYPQLAEATSVAQRPRGVGFGRRPMTRVGVGEAKYADFRGARGELRPI
jgi:hypothetical protein